MRYYLETCSGAVRGTPAKTLLLPPALHVSPCWSIYKKEFVCFAPTECVLVNLTMKPFPLVTVLALLAVLQLSVLGVLVTRQLRGSPS